MSTRPIAPDRRLPLPEALSKDGWWLAMPTARPPAVVIDLDLWRRRRNRPDAHARTRQAPEEVPS
jgi:hypothetical protein